MKQEIENITEAINYWYFDVRRSSTCLCFVRKLIYN